MSAHLSIAPPAVARESRTAIGWSAVRPPWNTVESKSFVGFDQRAPVGAQVTLSESHIALI
eukprot:6615911-Prymnesium_polylepis.1